MSNLEKIQLEKLKKQFHLTTFVETGCYMGAGIQTALEVGFHFVYSCDVSDMHVEHCRRRFDAYPNVRIEVSDSMSFLKSIVGIHLPPSLFWLDAHFPAFYGLNEQEKQFGRFPLLDELQLISTFESCERNVILADDMRVIADDLNPRWRAGETDGYFTIHNILIQDLVEPFTGTHDAFVDVAQEGILTLTPKATNG